MGGVCHPVIAIEQTASKERAKTELKTAGGKKEPARETGSLGRGGRSTLGGGVRRREACRGVSKGAGRRDGGRREEPI